ncbi:MAG: hypothetical protein K2W96_12555 [Gemmataceae bacterium]|nr:hypothetical protein [Gemmataceae bacterium]
MPETNCPGCGRRIEYGEDEAGTLFECAKCGEKVRAGGAPPPVRMRSPEPEDEAPDHRGYPLEESPGPEPWYYRHLVLYAWVVCVIGMLYIALSLVVLIAMALDGKEAPAIPLLIILHALAAIAVLAFVAFVLLAVDIGRNLRAMRQRLDDRR